MSGSLILVATPIGNLGDMSLRGQEALTTADLVLCEDTRKTAKLLTLLGLKAPLKRCDDHVESRLVDEVLTRLAAGQTLALVSDAGTPLISDPGYRLVRAVRAAGFAITATPGPAAPILALILSGLPSDRFFFGGFVPTKTRARLAAFQEIASLRATSIFFDNPKRLPATLEAAEQVFSGERPMAFARELTKQFEEVRQGTIAEFRQELSHPMKGELVLLFGPAPAQDLRGSIDALLTKALATQSAASAAKEVSRLTGRPKSEVYARALQLKGS